ncbi:MAG: GNAT family N-acetyltransferase [Candidatus Eisenbacteria bacterium]|nr:GNAT family N-acetyltransferase [Candidatus Eisenbacteria bacterium]
MTARFDPRPVTLEGERVRLEPLCAAHAEDLWTVGRDPETWAYMARTHLASADDAREWVAQAGQAMDGGSQVAFAVVLRRALEAAGMVAGRAVGSTRFMDIRRNDRALEIGSTWLAPAVRRTTVNTECKYLLLRHAFEDLGAVRVQLKTDARNLQSQRAIERIGALREGVLRRHMVTWSGFVRDTVYYSVIDAEWPAVKLRLEGMLAGRPAEL